MGGLPGARMARWAQRFATYAMGDEPLRLVPVPGGGGSVSIPFIHDEEGRDGEWTEAGDNEDRVLVVYVGQDPDIARAWQYTFEGFVWTVETVEPDFMAGQDWPNRVVLVRHAQ